MWAWGSPQTWDLLVWPGQGWGQSNGCLGWPEGCPMGSRSPSLAHPLSFWDEAGLAGRALIMESPRSCCIPAGSSRVSALWWDRSWLVLTPEKRVPTMQLCRAPVVHQQVLPHPTLVFGGCWAEAPGWSPTSRGKGGSVKPMGKVLCTYVGMAKETLRSPSPRTSMDVIAIFSRSFFWR